jgi:uncharacterized protein (TIGR02600 family)
MKLSLTLRPVRPVTRGVALVIVLSMLVLLSALLVAFMTTASTERSASFANAGLANSRQIADSTVSLVISQIRDATSVPDPDVTWASQPGVIRTFGGKLVPGGTQKGTLGSGAYWDDYAPSSSNIKSNRAADGVYKLYSADKMFVSSKEYADNDLDGTKASGDVQVVENWEPLDEAANTKRFPDFVDLNKPILSLRRDADEGGKVVEPRYPIIDPRAKLNQSNAEGNPGLVDGFDAKLTFTSSNKLDMMKLDGKTAAGTGVPYLPLPVKWLYVLRDGTIGSAKLATDNNPIVGRTAFWTDDESCKLNINTASEGTYWDYPMCSSSQEVGGWATSGSIPALSNTPLELNLATSQPIRGEYQRYPGHPATTSLSPVLGWLWSISSAPAAASTPVGPYTSAGLNTPYLKFKEAIYRMSPYTPYGLGTSQGGTHNSEFEAKEDGSLTIGTKHLYPSVDEMVFRSPRFTTNGTPDLNLVDPATPTSSIPPEALERVRFFLTANSRAPELNLFSRPRVTIWPVNSTAKYRTSFDDLFIFTSTLAKGAGGGPAGVDKLYCFLRADAKNAVTDFNAGRNADLYAYLQKMTSQSIPGFGKSLELTWSREERDEILLLMMDYMRTVNLVDTGTTSRAGNVYAPYTPKFFYIDPPKVKDSQYTRYDRSYDWSGQVTPLRRSTAVGELYQGLGRFPLISEAAIVFTKATKVGAPAADKFMRATLILEMSTVMPGYPALRETFWTRIKPVRATKIAIGDGTAASYNFCGDDDLTTSNTGLINVCNVGSHENAQGRAYMPDLGVAAWLSYYPEHKAPTLMGATALEKPPTDPNRIGTIMDPKPKLFSETQQTVSKSYKRSTTGVPGTVNYYPYSTGPIPCTGKTTFSFQAGAYDIEIWSGEAPDDTRSQLVQTVHLDFPNTMIPTAPGKFTIPTGSDLSARLASTIDAPGDIIQGGDIVRSMELVGPHDPMSQAGDLRLAAARIQVPSNYYIAREGDTAKYTSATPMLHGLVRGHGDWQTGYLGADNDSVGQLVAGSKIRKSKPPILPMTVKGVKRIDGGDGDWDRGLSKHVSGAFGNKVDEGNLKFDYLSGNTNYTSKPYYRGRGAEETGQTFFTPNRQIPSAVMMGSIPTGVVRGYPWQTLLFRPNRESKIHPGADTTKGSPDHLILDLFNMPVVEPYAISEPFSTAGKVNMNYVIAPFGYAKGASGSDPDSKQPRSYVRRDTALRGVLKSTYVTMIPTGEVDMAHTEDPDNQKTAFRYPIDMSRTLEEFEARLKYKNGQYPLFRSASEICTVDLYPKSVNNALVPAAALPGSGANGWETVWKANAITGDNQRERPYAHIFPRLTTKSNVYTVHMRCQAIRKSANSKVDEFDPKLDSVVGEYRGSSTIERFIDPNDEALKDYNEQTQKVDTLYRYRVVNTKLFAPK